jgi:hypothetical protein
MDDETIEKLRLEEVSRGRPILGYFQEEEPT